MSKGKTFVFVDTENVGHAMPTKIPKTMKAYFYIKDKNILPKVYPSCMHKRIKLIDLATRATKTKNEMDLALVTQLSIAIAKHGKKRKYVVLSNDKGYDYPIHLLRQSYGVDLNRVCCSLDEYIGQLTGDVKDQPEEKPEPAAAQPEPKRPESVETKPLEEIIRVFSRVATISTPTGARKKTPRKNNSASTGKCTGAARICGSSTIHTPTCGCRSRAACQSKPSSRTRIRKKCARRSRNGKRKPSSRKSPPSKSRFPKNARRKNRVQKRWSASGRCMKSRFKNG